MSRISSSLLISSTSSSSFSFFSSSLKVKERDFIAPQALSGFDTIEALQHSPALSSSTHALLPSNGASTAFNADLRSSKHPLDSIVNHYMIIIADQTSVDLLNGMGKLLAVFSPFLFFVRVMQSLALRKECLDITYILEDWYYCCLFFTWLLAAGSSIKKR